MILALLPLCPAASVGGMRLVDFGKLGVDSQITVNGAAEVATQLVEDPRGKSLEVRCTPGANPAPGVVIRPGDVLHWNLSAHGEVEADVTNLSDTPLVINLRVDNPGDGRETRGNTDKVALPVGKSGTVRVFFGYTMARRLRATIGKPKTGAMPRDSSNLCCAEERRSILLLKRFCTLKPFRSQSRSTPTAPTQPDEERIAFSKPWDGSVELRWISVRLN